MSSNSIMRGIMFIGAGFMGAMGLGFISLILLFIIPPLGFIGIVGAGIWALASIVIGMMMMFIPGKKE